MLKGILWDNDGVLVDTEYLFFLANKKLLNQYDLDVTAEDYFDWYLNQNRGVWHLFDGIGMHASRQAELRETRNAMFRDIIAETEQLKIPGIDNVLDTVAPQLKMGIVTSAYKDNFLAIHKKTNLLPHFDFVLTSEDYNESKPSPEPYLLGLDKLGLHADDCIVVEDSPRGLQAAQAAGIRCIVLQHEMTRRFSFDGAYAVVPSTKELLNVLQNLMA